MYALNLPLPERSFPLPSFPLGLTPSQVNDVSQANPISLGTLAATSYLNLLKNLGEKLPVCS